LQKSLNFDFSYTATSSSAVFGILLSENQNALFYVDNVAMYVVPEPSPCLLLLGGGVLIYVCKRKRLNP
jgi:hypothetical protein